MFFQYTKEGMQPVASEKIDESVLTVGYVQVDELEALRERFHFAESTVESCRVGKRYFRSGVEVYDDYTFTELRILNCEDSTEDCIALYLCKNLLLVVDVQDEDGSTQKLCTDTFHRRMNGDPTLEKAIFALLDSMVSGDIKTLEDVGTQLSEQEENLLHEKVHKEMNADLFQLKKTLSRQHNYYEQILDITEAICENDNDIFDESSLIYIINIAKKVERLREDTDSLRSTVEHLQDAYSSYLDSKMNSTMKIFTVLTSVFFPLTIIVGWYGMNFTHMPELTWRYGYVYVIVLSVVTVLILTIFGKKKKWF